MSGTKYCEWDKRLLTSVSKTFSHSLYSLWKEGKPKCSSDLELDVINKDHNEHSKKKTIAVKEYYAC